jgi:hypothetical protein
VDNLSKTYNITMKQKLLYIIFIVIYGINLNAQVSFSHAAGIKLLVPAFNSASVLDIESEPTLGLMYSPRVNVIQFNNSTISLGTHFAMAFEGSFNTNGNNSSSFVFDIPFVIEYNFGLASNRRNTDKFGLYVGGGYGVHNSGGSETISSKISGFIGNIGVRFFSFGVPFDIHASYLKGTGDTSNDSVFGLGLQYTFGF